MKKIKLLLMTIIGLFTISTIDVNAETIPESLKAEVPTGLKAEIKQIVVYVWNGKGLEAIDSADGELTDKRWKKEVTGLNPTNEHYSAFKLKNGAIRIANRIDVEGGYTELEKKFMETVRSLKSELKDGVDGTKYYAALTVKYKLTLPSGVEGIVDNDDLYKVFSGDQATKDVTDNQEQNDGLSQMIISAIYDSSVESVQAKEDFDFAGTMTYGEKNRTITARADDIAIMDEYLLNEKKNDINQTEKYRFFIHTKGTDEALYSSSVFKRDLASVNNDITTPEKVETPTKNSQVVSVPNTAAKDSARLLFGSSILMIGSAIVLFQLSKKRTN